MRRINSLIVLLCIVVSAVAQGPNNTGTYYRAANGLKGQALKTALFKIIGNHTDVGYDGLWRVYLKSDLRPDGTYWDMYSSTSKFKPGAPSSYSKEGDGLNREHSVPQSWFGKRSPMKSDAFHVVPTDGYVNNRRGSFPYGEVGRVTYSSNGGFSKVGDCVTAGYSGTVFEPNDEYKGDLARGYFYMATAYENQAGSWGGVFGNGTYYCIQKWQMDLLLRWAKEDPVSQKEIDRNNAIYGFQHNRNPFIDYPGLEQYVWGSKTSDAFSYDNYGGAVNPGEPSDPTEPTDPVEPTDPTEPVDPNPVDPSTGDMVFNKVTSASQLVIGQGYLIVCEESKKALSSSNSSYRSGADVVITGNSISTQVNQDGMPTLITLGGTAGAYTLKVDTDKYLALTADKNQLNTVDVLGSNTQWSISVNSDESAISSTAIPARSIRWNDSAPRFSTYSQGQMSVQLYVLDNAFTSVKGLSREQKPTVIHHVDGTRATQPLRPGLYIVNGRKIVVK